MEDISATPSSKGTSEAVVSNPPPNSEVKAEQRFVNNKQQILILAVAT